ncbi:MAG: hypothetical protein B7Z66_11700 [Chromatiales bacterium 21-64-14]|nr:MAG: hypothetical protein B7Z66_11700 [Chromatiales bacterium 21-64-14]
MLIAVLRTRHPKLADVLARFAHHGVEIRSVLAVRSGRFECVGHISCAALVVYGVDSPADADQLRRCGAVVIRVVDPNVPAETAPCAYRLQADYPVYVTDDAPVAPEIDALLHLLGYLDPLSADVAEPPKSG